MEFVSFKRFAVSVIIDFLLNRSRISNAAMSLEPKDPAGNETSYKKVRILVPDKDHSLFKNKTWVSVLLDPTGMCGTHRGYLLFMSMSHIKL